jgi:dTDP-4-dehydrorhamnose reductase
MQMSHFKILILGANGMLGSQLYTYLSDRSNFDVFGTVRDHRDSSYFPDDLAKQIFTGISAENLNSIFQPILEVKPDLVINCIGIIKQMPAAKDPLKVISINALFPHQLASICQLAGARLFQISTDCVFDGKQGMYDEASSPNPPDLYGRSKLLGEVDGFDCDCLTIRTSIIGHELTGRHGLVEWFLGQSETVQGFTKAIYTGLPTIELARVIADYIIIHPELNGIYHISSSPISKYELLNLIKKTYAKPTRIIPNDSLEIDRSLNSALFAKLTGYSPPPWIQLVNEMYRGYCHSPLHRLAERGNVHASFKE